MKKRVLIKLGNKCNKNCTYCHSSKNLEFEFNNDIIKYIKAANIAKIGFGGGEPLLYFDKIKNIVEKLNDSSIFYKFTTNGFLFDSSKVDFINQHKMTVVISYDGEDVGRNYPDNEKLTLFSQIRNKAISSLHFKKTAGFQAAMHDFYNFANKIEINKAMYYPSFIHQTDINVNSDLVDKNTLKEYIEHINFVHELQVRRFLISPQNVSRSIMLKIGERYNDNLYKHGVECCNENNLMLTASGDFLFCPYGNNKVGDIYKGVDWGYVESLVPKRCQHCSLRSKCGGACATNIINNECYIYQNTYEHFLKICDKYKVTPQSLKNMVYKEYLENKENAELTHG